MYICTYGQQCTVVIFSSIMYFLLPIQSYNLHVNGVFHCSLRFSQLHDFHEQVKKEFGTDFLGTFKFPPKKLLPLTPPQVDERRQKLEKYIQLGEKQSSLE